MTRLRRAVNNVDLQRFRFWFQLAAFALLVYGGYLAIDLGNSLPMFSCGYNQEGRAGVCYLLPLQHQLARPWPQLFGWAGIGVLTGFGLFLLWFIVLNKGWCGFMCPLGTLQDWLTGLRKRLGIRYSLYGEKSFNTLTWVKFVLLALMLLIPLAIGGGFLSHDWGAPFCQICPGRVVLPLFTGDPAQLTIDYSSVGTMVLTGLGMFIAGLFLAGAFIKKRFFCFFCPMSALHYLIAKPALLKLKKDGDKCTRCGNCFNVCDMEIRAIADDLERQDIMTDDCTLCLKCVAACPEPGALRVEFARINIFEATEEGFLKRMNKGAGRDGCKH
ncbi:MAG: 4Fe-4S binding protein [Hydrogenophilaceae bacterium]